MLDYQAIIKSDTATRLLNVFTFEYNCLSDLNFNELTEHENIDGFDFELIEILNKKALFTNGRIPDYVLPDGLHKYELRGGDTEDFYTVEKSVLVNHSGTILMCEPLKFGKNDYIELDENTAPNFLGIDMSVSEFCTSSENKGNFCPYCGRNIKNEES